MITSNAEDDIISSYHEEIEPRLSRPFDTHSNEEIASECARFLLLAPLGRKTKRDLLLLRKSLTTSKYPSVTQTVRTAIATLITNHFDLTRQKFRGSDEAIALLRRDLRERSFDPEVARQIRNAIRSRNLSGMYGLTRQIDLETPLIGVKVFGRSTKPYPVQTLFERLLSELSMLLCRIDERLKTIEAAVVPVQPDERLLTFSDRFEAAYDRKMAELKARQKREADQRRRVAAKAIKSKAQDPAEPSKPSRGRRGRRTSSNGRR